MGPLVGRDRPVAVLQAEIDRTVSSHGGLVFVTGEAGIGKTALVAEASEAAEAKGALVANGTCWDREGAPGYWPWVQIVRSLDRATDPDVWTAARAAAGGELAVLLGEADGPQLANPNGDDSFGLSDAVTTLLVTMSRSQPVVVVLDDLHWADPASIRLLEFVTRHTWFEQILVIGTYRDVEVDATDHPLAALLLPLVAKATSVTLTGLDRDDVGVLLARTADRQPSEEMVAEVHRRTGGNPFFVDQTARLWHSSNAVDVIAPGVRDVVERRLGLLPEAVLEVLRAAAVVGPEFHRDLLTASAGIPEREMAALLREAVAARLIMPVDQDHYAFVHDLVRETLYARLDEAEARQRHAAVLRALEKASELGQQNNPAELAHHAYQAVPDIPPVDAVTHLRAAGRKAFQRMAVDEAAGHLRRGLELVPQDRPRDWATIALDLASAQHHLGEMAACRQLFEEVAAVARKLEDDELLARAALRLRGAVWLVHPREVAGFATHLVNEAHDKLIGEVEPPTAHGSRNQAPDQRTDLQREQELSVRALELARESGDDDALMDALCARNDAIWMAGTAPERELIADEMVVVAHRMSDPSSEMFSVLLKSMALLEQGHPRCRDEHASFIALAESMNSMLSCWVSRWAQATFAALAGRFHDARTYLDEVSALDAQRRHFGGEQPDDMAVLGVQQRWAVELLQGRFEAAEAVLRSARDVGHPYPDLLAAITAVQRGDVDPALRYYSRVASTDEQPSRWFSPMWLRLQAQVAAASRDPELCEAARAALQPAIGEWAVMFGEVPHGPMVLWSALVDAAEERWEEAIDGFTAAGEAADRLGARPWSIEARLQLAEALLRRGSSDDGETATSLLDDVEREAGNLGMNHAAKRARRARQQGSGYTTATGSGQRTVGSAGSQPAAQKRVPSGSSTPGAPPLVYIAPNRHEPTQPVTRAPNVFRLDGQVWTLTYGGRTVHMPDAKGLRDLHFLISQPGTDVRSVDLLAPEGGEAARTARRLGGDPVLDEKAKSAYQKRLTQLDEQIDRALDRQDDQRAGRLDEERAALIEEIRRATGLGGRPRRLGDEGERARKAVSERIRDSLRRLDQRHPELAEHLRASVSTGASCRYQPADDVTWSLS